ncbi:hypothetical protein PUN28_008191 [Cardiocondyla obscurior]|uniref:Uncharacterized protein n=1 Tax=Cardiocondyla obscurior TaxID=286306 RepID=A0AAW2G2T5_9HYME
MYGVREPVVCVRDMCAQSCKKDDRVARSLLGREKGTSTELETAHEKYNEQLFQTDISDEDLAKELETDDSYKASFITAQLRVAITKKNFNICYRRRQWIRAPMKS